MTWSISTLLLIAVVIIMIMASRASVQESGPSAPGLGCRVTRFVYAKCSETSQLSSRGGACFSGGRRSGATSLPPSRAVQPKWASWKSKLMSGPVTSWPERGTRPGRLTPTRRYCMPQMSFLVIIYLVPSISNHQRVHASGIAVEHAGWYARGPRFESELHAQLTPPNHLKLIAHTGFDMMLMLTGRQHDCEKRLHERSNIKHGFLR
jgi:hypothetical protein